jgi:hypothetical protein
MYIDLAQVYTTLHCSILRLLLVGDAETWYNSLTDETQLNFRQLEGAFRNQYIDPVSNKFAMLSDFRVRVQGPNESLRTFLTEAGAPLKAMGYPRELWLDLIYPVLLPSIQNVLQGFATNITSYDELLAECDRIERTARLVQPPPTVISAINTTQLLPFPLTESQLLGSSDKLQASIARLNVESPQNNNNQRDSRPRVRPQFDRPSNRSPNFNTLPRCFYCNITGHVQRDCRKKRHDMTRHRNFSNFNQNSFSRRVTFQDERPPYRGRPQNRGFSGYSNPRNFSGDRNRWPYRQNLSLLNQHGFNNTQFQHDHDNSLQRENYIGLGKSTISSQLQVTDFDTITKNHRINPHLHINNDS